MNDDIARLERQGRWPEVARLCDRLLRARPDDAALWQHKAAALSCQNDLPGAVGAWRRAVELAPYAPELRYGLGNALLAAGDFAAAAEAFRAVLRQRPDLVEARNALGNALARQGEMAAAMDAWQQAIAQNPRYAKAHYNLGKALGEQRAWAESERHLRRAVALAPDHVPAWNNLGNALRGQYRLDEAEQCYRRALGLAADHVDAIRNLVQVVKDSSRLDEALALAERALRLAPQAAESHVTHAGVLLALRRWEEAEAAYQRAIALSPASADGHAGLAHCLAERGDETGALAAARRARALAPEKGSGWHCEAEVLGAFSRWDEALAAIGQAIAREPDSPEWPYSGSLTLLRLGRYREGWAAYERRKQCPSLGPQPYMKFEGVAPRWDGAPLPGKRLLVYAEQGLGDTLQFARFLPRVRERVGEVVLAAHPPLLGLIERMGVVAQLRSFDGEPPACDAVCSLVSLPHVLGIGLADLPGPSPYLHADPQRVGHWRASLGETRGLRVGLVWGGNPRHANDHRRSLPLEALRPLFAIDGIDWYGLQVGPRSAEIEACGLGGRLTDLSPHLTDFDESAAAVACLDLVISADTSTAHLAGALGRPTWVMVQEPADWRWLVGRDDSPWYPAARLFRQRTPGDWAGVVSALTQALRDRVGHAAAPVTAGPTEPPRDEPMQQRPHADPEPRIYRPSAEEDLAGPSPGLGAWLQAQGISLALTTYQSSRLYLIGSNEQGKVSLFKRLFEHAMGLYATGERLWLASRFQVWRLENVLAEGERYDGYDRLFVPRSGHTTGDLDMHDLVVDGEGTLMGVATRLNALVTLDDRFGVRLLWKPPFIEPLADGDRCHLNGLALRDGRPAFATLVGESNEPDGWRAHRAGGGQLWDLAANRPLVTGLSMPHSPRWYRDRLWLLNSGRGEFGYVDLEQGRFVPVHVCPGYPRGLAFHGDYALVGLSLPRDKTFNGLPLDEVLASHGLRPQCGLLVINLSTFEVEHSLRFEGVVRELYDIQVVPGALRPTALGFQTDEIKSLVSVSVEGRPLTFSPPRQEPEPEAIRAPAPMPVAASREPQPADPELALLRREVLEQPSAAGFFRLGQAFRQRQAWLGAVDAFKQATELDPAQAMTHHYLGMVYLAMDQKNSAEEAFEKALELNPKLARTRSNLAQLYLGRGSVQQAAEQFALALADEPGFLPARFGSIESLSQLGRAAGAAEQRRLAEQMIEGLPQEQAAPWREQLRRLEPVRSR